MDRPRVLLTGGNGFIGGAVGRALCKKGCHVVASVRKIPTPETFDGYLGSNCFDWRIVGPITSSTRWQEALENVETVVHCAARSQISGVQKHSALEFFREVNVAGTLHLAKAAAQAGVRRFVFLSTIKVNGEVTPIGRAFTEWSEIAPKDSYAQSKAEAEHALMLFAKQAGMELVIIRPPLVIGPGFKGNLATMLHMVQSGIPLPLGAVNNQRSIVSLDNLVNLVVLCTHRSVSPQAAGNVFIVADEEDVSTTLLLQKLALAAKCKCRLFSVPPYLLRAVGRIIQKPGVVDRLLGNLQVDPRKASSVLGWKPVINLDQQLAAIFENIGKGGI